MRYNRFVAKKSPELNLAQAKISFSLFTGCISTSARHAEFLSLQKAFPGKKGLLIPGEHLLH